MKISEQILLKRYIIDSKLVGSTIKINNESFTVTKYSKNDELLKLSRMFYTESEMKPVGSFIAIDNASFIVDEDNGKILSLEIYSVILHDSENTLIIFDDGLKSIEKQFILEDYKKGDEVEVEGNLFLISENNGNELTLIPVGPPCDFKMDLACTYHRYIEGGIIVQKSV